MSRASVAHLGAVANLGCIICSRFLSMGYVPAEVHHCFDTSDKSDFLTIPLCPEHHRGGTGFHGLGERAFNRTYNTSERRLLGMVIEALRKAA
jgi:hypothetical protein